MSMLKLSTISKCIVSMGLKMLNADNVLTEFNNTNFSKDVMAITSNSNLFEIFIEDVFKSSGIKLRVLNKVPNLFFKIRPIHSEWYHKMTSMLVKNSDFSKEVFLMSISNDVEGMDLAPIKPFEVSAC